MKREKVEKEVDEKKAKAKLVEANYDKIDMVIHDLQDAARAARYGLHEFDFRAILSAFDSIRATANRGKALLLPPEMKRGNDHE